MRRLFFLLAVSCGDDIQKLTWGDAMEQWSGAWCDFVERCNPDVYQVYGGDEYCVERVTKLNCENGRSCGERYPRDWELIDQCVYDFGLMECGEWLAPPSCYEAFQTEGKE